MTSTQLRNTALTPSLHGSYTLLPRQGARSKNIFKRRYGWPAAFPRQSGAGNGGPSYTASKHAVIGLTKSVALEYATAGLRNNAIAPGGTETAMLSSGTQEQRNTLASYSAMKRLAEPIEIARGIIYLLVDATFSIGTVLQADGGQSVG